jgi:hypothetical protein
MPPCQLRDMQMAGMGRIERAAQQTDADSSPVTPSRQNIGRGDQGRTWPVPVTR